MRTVAVKGASLFRWRVAASSDQPVGAVQIHLTGTDGELVRCEPCRVHCVGAGAVGGLVKNTTSTSWDPVRAREMDSTRSRLQLAGRTDDDVDRLTERFGGAFWTSDASTADLPEELSKTCCRSGCSWRRSHAERLEQCSRRPSRAFPAPDVHGADRARRWPSPHHAAAGSRRGKMAPCPMLSVTRCPLPEP